MAISFQKYENRIVLTQNLVIFKKKPFKCKI